MKRLFILFIIVLSVSNIFSQELIRQDCHTKKKKCKPKLEVYLLSDSTYLVKEYEKNGILVYEAYSSNSDPDSLNGIIKFYSGKKVSMEGKYRDGVACCDWKIYDKGKFKRSISYDRPVPKKDKEYPIIEYTDDKWEVMPSYGDNGVEAALNKYIVSEIIYPPMARHKNIAGRVYVSFVVDRFGNVIEEKILRGVNPDLDAEALRVIRNAREWTPGYQKGKPVKVQYTVPINFTLS